MSNLSLTVSEDYKLIAYSTDFSKLKIDSHHFAIKNDEQDLINPLINEKTVNPNQTYQMDFQAKVSINSNPIVDKEIANAIITLYVDEIINTAPILNVSAFHLAAKDSSKITFLNTENTEINNDYITSIDLSQKHNKSIVGYKYSNNEFVVASQYQIAAPENIDGMFSDFTKLKTVKFDNFDMSKTSSANSMFKNCYLLEGEIDFKNLNNLSSIKSYNNMFENTGRDGSGLKVLPKRQNLNNDLLDDFISTGKFVERSPLEAILLDGPSFNTIFKTVRPSLYGLKFTCSAIPSDKIPEAILVSTPESDAKIYLYKTNENSLVVSPEIEGMTIQANENCSKMFENLPQGGNITFDNFDTSKVKNMHRMFADNMGCYFNISNFKTDNVEDMSEMLYNQYYVYVSIRNTTNNWNLSKVKNMDRMFMSTMDIQTSLTIRNTNTTYSDIFKDTTKIFPPINSTITVNYIDNETKAIAEKMIATQEDGKTAVLGTLVK